MKNTNNKKRCIIYSRVSCSSKQDTSNQSYLLKKYALENKYIIVDIIEEGESTRRERKKLQKILNRNDYDVLLIYVLDRISRNGLFETINIIKHLSDRNIAIESYTEPMLNTKNELVRNILLTVLSSFAKMEREKISLRTKAGLERAKRQGKKIGRPEKTVSNERLRKIKKLRSDGMGYGTIGKQVKMKRSTVRYVCKKYNYTINNNEKKK